MNRIYCILLITVLYVSAHSVPQDRCRKPNGEPLHISFVSVPTKGHINPFIGSAQQLVNLGCRVSIPITANKTHWVTAYEGIEAIAVPSEAELSVQVRRELTVDNNNSGLWEKITSLFSSGSDRFRMLLVDMVLPVGEFLLEEHKQGRYNPDILVTEKMFSSLGDVGHVIGAQVVMLNPGVLKQWGEEVVHYIPNPKSGLPLEMNYFERVANYFVSPQFFQYFFLPFLRSAVYEVREALQITDKVPSYILTTNFTGLEMTQSFFGFEYAQPLPPNHFLVGPALPLTLKPLPERIVTWIDLHKNQPIYYMCMGTVATFTVEMIKPLLAAFTDQPYSVIWSFPENQRDILEGVSIPPNVILEDFLPQRELLLREEIAAFISHGGASSSFEAITSGTPVLCMPFMGDQFDFCRKLVNAGFAVEMDKFALEVDEIRSALAHITNPSFVNNAKRIQNLAKSAGGAEKVAELILSSYHDGVEHLVRHKHYLPWYQVDALDLRLTQFVFVFCLPFILFYSAKLLFLCCGVCCCRKKGKKTIKTE